MDDLTSLIDRVQNGEIDAFTPIVEKFKDMVVGYAYAILGDFHKAEDAAQDAFIVAFLNLDIDPRARCLSGLDAEDRFYAVQPNETKQQAIDSGAGRGDGDTDKGTHA